MTIILIALAAVILLVALGEIFGTRIPILKKAGLPGAVLGGIIGLIVGPEGLKWATNIGAKDTVTQVYSQIASFPALFINVVFACLMLGKPIDHLSNVWKRARPHIVMGHIIAWGQYVVGGCITLFLLSPFLSVDPLAAPSIAIGFQGGHGTAAGLTENYQAFDFADGKPIAYTIATIGVILATVICPLIARELSSGKTTDYSNTDKERSNVDPGDEETKNFSALTGMLTIHFALITITIILAWLFLYLLTLLEGKLRPGTDRLFTEFIPLFSVVLISGLFVQLFIQRFKLTPFFRRALFNKISAFGLDIVIVSALTALSMQVVKEYWVTILLLALAGFGWNLAVFFLLGPRLFPKPWAPYALSDLGGGTGTTASGLMLIRVADPEKKTNAQQTYSEKQPFYEPIMGGGLVTAMALPLVEKLGLSNVLFITSGILLIWIIYAVFLIQKKHLTE